MKKFKKSTIILSGVLLLSALSGCSSLSAKEPQQVESQQQSKPVAKTEIHEAKKLKPYMLQFLKMDSKEALAFANDKLSDKIKLEDNRIVGENQTMTLESDYKGMRIYNWYESDKISYMNFSNVEDKKAIANSIEDAKELISEFGISPMWENDTNESNEAATKEKGGRHCFISKIDNKTVYLTVLTHVRDNNETVSAVCVSLENN
ncbi:hypothetical protein bcgnr5390_10420 [Bacillus luti]|nr:hypothetical protein BC2903_30490 [Bacillus cereus]